MTIDNPSGSPDRRPTEPGGDAERAPQVHEAPPAGSTARSAPSTASGATPDTLTRFLAFLIDGIVVGLVGLVPVIGGLAGIAYALFRDGLDVDFMRHRSLGKRVMKMAVVRADGGAMDLMTSARRNWPLVFGSLVQILLFIPVLGWVLIPFVGLAGLVLVIVEIVRVLSAPDGRRWGDTLAGTRVVLTNE